MSMVDEIVKPRPTLDAKGTTTLQKLGYNMVGIDEGWEGCGMGVNHTQHYVNGTPAVRTVHRIFVCYYYLLFYYIFFQIYNTAYGFRRHPINRFVQTFQTSKHL